MLKLVVLAALGYGLLVITVYLMQGRMLYLANVPGRDLTATPADIRLEYEDVTIEAEDGVSLHGWFIPGENSRTLLFFHGNAGNISHRLDSIRQFHRFGLVRHHHGDRGGDRIADPAAWPVGLHH